MVCFLEASFGHNLRHFLSISGNCCRINDSDGLFKMPIAFAKDTGSVESPDEFKKSHAGASYYPRIDTLKTSSVAMSTIYIDDKKSDKVLIKGLSKAIQKAITQADNLLPEESRKVVQSYLR